MGVGGERTEGGEEQEEERSVTRDGEDKVCEEKRDLKRRQDEEFKGHVGSVEMFRMLWTPSSLWEDESVVNNSPSMAVNACSPLSYIS